MTTYPNQKVITVNKDIHDKDSQFLQVKNINWQTACQNLTYSAFKIYLYMASNKDGYRFALSYEAINELIPMNRKTYDKCIIELKECGFLVNKKGNEWTFYEAI